MKPTTGKMYLVLMSVDDTSSFFKVYSSIEQAIIENRDHDDENVEIYEATPKLLGTFKVQPVLVKSKGKKK